MNLTESFTAVERAHQSGVYAPRDIAFVRGEAATLFTADDRPFIDCAAGHGVANVGHAHPRVVAAIQAQVARLTTCAQTYANDRRAELYTRLSGVTPGGLDRFFLCNSGTEAVEAAIKFARISTGRSGILALRRGFHGRTLGALSATWERRYREPFAPLVPGFAHLPFDDLDAARAAIDASTAAIIVEIVQGEGGVHAASAEFLHGLRELCNANGALLIVDEVQTGFGRTGSMFACEAVDLVPDLLCLGKAIAAGVPMGAVAIGPRVGALPAGCHGSTFGGNPLACAAAVATLDVIADEGLVERAKEHGTWLLEQLRALHSPAIREVRGRGLMVGIECKQRATPLLQQLLARGIVALPAGTTVLRLLPPLVITRAQLQSVVDAIERSLEQIT